MASNGKTKKTTKSAAPKTAAKTTATKTLNIISI